MATITKIARASGFVYKAVIRKNGQLLKTKTFDRKKDAQAWANALEADAQRMESLQGDGAGLTLSDLINQYIRQFTGRDHSRLGTLAFWNLHLGQRKLPDLTTKEIRTLLDGYAKGAINPPRSPDDTMSRKPGPRKPASVNRLKASLAAVLRFGMERELVTDNPARRIPSRTENNAIVRFLDDDERARLLVACKASTWDKLYLLVLLALTTGARQGELLNLRWSHIDFSKGLASLERTKNGDRRTLPIPANTLAELKQFRELGDGLVFPSKQIPTQPFEFRKQWENALQAAGIENFRFHDLRHSAASYLVMSGATLHETAEVLGHRSIQTTKRYAHLSTEHKSALVARVLGGIG